MDIIKYLQKSPLFSGLEDSELSAVADIIGIKKLNKGAILFLDGDEASGFYILFDGRIRIFKSNPDGKEYTIHLINPGQIFGEVAIFEGKHFPANSSAIENSVVGFFPKKSFLSLIRQNPNISLKIISSLSRFLREYNMMVENLALKEVPARIAGFLLSKVGEKDSNRVYLDISKTELAKRLGTISETLSRNLKKLKDDGIISDENTIIEILDFTRLSAIANGEKL